jgi:hypothetical protein
VHTKNLTFLLRLLQASQQSGKLFVEPPEQNEANRSSGSQRSSWQGQFQLDKGVVTSCLIRNKTDGQVWLINEDAVNWLREQGKLEWRLEKNAEFSGELRQQLPQYSEPPREQGRENTGPVLLPSSAKWGKQLSNIPQRIVRESVAAVNALPSRTHRQVYALVDGQRSIEEITYLLHKPPDVIIQLLQDLQMVGLIV